MITKKDIIYDPLVKKDFIECLKVADELELIFNNSLEEPEQRFAYVELQESIKQLIKTLRGAK